LLLRDLRVEDAEFFFEMNRDPDVMEFSLGNGCASVEEERQLIHEHITGYYQKYGFGFWAVVLRETEELIGRCGLLLQMVDDISEVEIAYRFAKEYWNRGFATEAVIAVKDKAFNELNINRLISIIDSRNVASQRVAIKAGLTLEKTTVYRGKAVQIYSVQKNLAYK